jgi:hypothetical protein
VSEVQAHRHRYRSPIAAIVGLAEAALQREDLPDAVETQLRAIRGLAKEALAADESREARRRGGRSPRPGGDPSA